MSGSRYFMVPLSFQQEEMVRLLGEFPDSAVRWDCLRLYALPPAVNITHLKSALEDLVLRHAALRTNIDGPAQCIHANIIAPVIVEKHYGTVDALANALLSRRYGAKEVRGGSPLFRAGIYEVDETRLLALAVHHLVHDGWSELVLWRDLSELYAARAEERQSELKPILFSYADFALKQRSAWLALGDRAVAYWRNEIAGHLEDLQWPLPNCAMPDRTGTEVTEVSAETVRHWVKAAHMPPFLVLLSATCVAISQVAGVRDFLIGSNTANRESPETWDVVGYFANTRLTRMQVPRGWRFSDLLTATKSSWLDSEEYRDAYVDPLLRRLGWPQLTKVDMLDFPGYMDAVPRLGVPVIPVPVHQETNYRRDILFSWLPGNRGPASGDAYTLTIKYRSARVDRAAAKRLAECVRAVLASPEGDS